jgi:hypothetical protein
MREMTDAELFKEFFRRVAGRALSELGVTVHPAMSPYTITWARGEFFSFDPVEAKRQLLDLWVDRAVARIRLWRDANERASSPPAG